MPEKTEEQMKLDANEALLRSKSFTLFCCHEFGMQVVHSIELDADKAIQLAQYMYDYSINLLEKVQRAINEHQREEDTP